VAIGDLAQVDPDAVSLDHCILGALGAENCLGDALDELLTTPRRERAECARRTFGNRDRHAIDRL
jgi:hypothetical protein